MTIGALAMSVATVACGGAGMSAGTPASTSSGIGAAATAAVPSSPALEMAREVTIPAGIALSVTLDTPVGSDISRVEEPVQGHLTRPLIVHGETVLETGSRVNGVVTDATRSAKVKGRAHVAVRFDTVTPRGSDERYNIRTASVGRTAAGTKEKDALEIGGGAAGGAIIGALLGGKKGALIGTAAGGGAGTAVVLGTSGKEVHMPKGSALTLRLAAPITIRVRS